MPTNKNALERYLIIDEKLRTNTRYSLEQLAKMCSDALETQIEPRTISGDLKFMRERFDAPIPKRPEDNRFGYTNRHFSIMTSPLAEKDVVALKKVLHILNDFQYLPQFHDIQSIILNLESRGHSHTDVPNNILSFDRSELVGIDYLKDFYEGIVKKHPLQVGYKPFDGDPNDDIRFTNALPFEQGKGFTFYFHPYFLKEFNNRWFVFGMNEACERVDCYALDRFAFVRHLELRPYILNTTIDFDTYFDHLIGVTNSPTHSVEAFQLRFQKPRAFYVRTKKWKPDQIEIEETPLSITFEWQLKYNRELEARVLEFGQDVEVLAPQWFQEKIAAIWQKALVVYNG
jgi:hypothetical protein